MDDKPLSLKAAAPLWIIALFILAFAHYSGSALGLILQRVSDQKEESILAVWKSADGNGKIQIYRRSGVYFGKIVFVKFENQTGAQVLDLKNPDPLKHKNQVLGIEILKSFSYSGDGVWNNGTIYDPKTGKTYSCKLTLESPNELKIRGYIGISLLGRTEIWKRSKL